MHCRASHAILMHRKGFGTSHCGCAASHRVAGSYVREISLWDLYHTFFSNSVKVRLRWFGAVLQYLCKFAVFILSFNIFITIIHH